MTCLRELPAVPDPLALHRHDPARYPCLLESVARGGGNGRWSLVFAFPQARLQARPGTDFLDRLDAAWRAERLPAADDADLPEGLPFRGGWFVYLGYELAAEVEPVLQLPAATDGLPRACALRVPAPKREMNSFSCEIFFMRSAFSCSSLPRICSWPASQRLRAA
ncbi:MAG TPA: hypothetical protein PLK47_15725, partial [Plasticicumulans sp.]|nr:hypothetical protein [Plasticicumulans sp.]